SASRERFCPIDQVHFGSRDLVFGLAYYRPESTGWNDVADVDRLTAYLDAVDPGRWSAAQLQDLPGLETPEDRQDELEFAHEWFQSLRDMYATARQRKQVIICDSLDGPPKSELPLPA